MSMAPLALLLLTIGLLNGFSWAVIPQAFCPQLDKASNSLVNTTNPFADPDGNFIQCTYGTNTSPCAYFTDGAFIAGSSDCPTSIAFFDFQCLAFNDPQVIANPLIGATNVSDSGFLALLCSYHDTTCTYSQSDGSLQGNSDNSCSPTVDPAKLPLANYTCVQNSTAQYGGKLLDGASVTANNELACPYAFSQCLYDMAKGQLTSGDGCPPSADPIETAGNASCPQTDSGGYNLLNTWRTPGPNDTIACLYDAHSLCTFLVSTGELISGSSTCSKAIPSASGAFGTDPVGAIASGGGNSVLAASGETASSSNSNSKMSPVVIALLAMNGFLVIGVLIIGGVWISNRRASPSAPRRYKKVISTGGFDEGEKHYDAPVLPYRPPSRM